MPSKADGAGGDELAAAQEELNDAEQGGRVTARTPWQSVVEARCLRGYHDPPVCTPQNLLSTWRGMLRVTHH